MINVNRIIPYIIILSIVSGPYITFGQSKDLRMILERGGALEKEESARERLLKIVEDKLIEEGATEQSRWLGIIETLNKEKIPYSIAPDGIITVNPGGNKYAEISEEKTIVKEKGGKTLDQIDLGWRRGVDVLFIYVLPPIIAAGLVKETAKTIFRVGLLRSPALLGWLGFYTLPITAPLGLIYLKDRAEKQAIEKTEKFRRQSRESVLRERLITQQERKKESENYYTNLLKKAIEEQK